MKLSIQVENELAKTFGPAPAVPPAGHSDLKSALVKAAEEAQYGRQTSAEAAKGFMAAATAAIGKG
jgi:pectin-derived oligosaccharide transport system substrate-binding protein